MLLADTNLGHGGSLMARMHAFSSSEPSSNLTEASFNF